MLRLHLELSFVRILYNEIPQKSHYVNFTLQNQEDDELHYEQKFITSQTDIVQLHQLTPFHFSMIISNSKRTLCPFVLNFVSKTNPTVVRKMPIHQRQILKHFLQHQIFADITPLQQVYTFEQGEIIYSVKVLDSQSVSSQETQKFTAEFANSSSVLSESLRTSRAGSLRDSRNNNFEAKDTGISTNIQINSQAENIDYLSLPEPELRTKSSMSKMSIEEIAEHLEMAKNQEAGTGEDSSIDVQHWQIKLARRDKSEIIQGQTHLTERSNFKLKLVYFLLVIGFAVMLFDFFTDKTYLRKGGPSAQKKKKTSRKSHSSRPVHQNYVDHT